MYRTAIRADDANVTTLYGGRTVATSCGYFLPYIKKTANIIDVGCGPGVITSDLAQIASEGRTIGIDNSEGIIAQAQAPSAADPVPNLSFAVGDAKNLSEYADNSFDIVHAHQLLVHMRDPVAVLKEFYRICKPGGIIAVRDNSSAIVTSLKPDHPAIREYWNRAIIVMGKMGSHPEGGRQLETWAKEAGLGADGGRLVTSTSKSFNSSHLVRTTGVAGEQAIQYGMCTKEELASWKEGWEEWEKTEGHEFVFEAREILYWKPEESV